MTCTNWWTTNLVLLEMDYRVKTYVLLNPRYYIYDNIFLIEEVMKSALVVFVAPLTCRAATKVVLKPYIKISRTHCWTTSSIPLQIDHRVRIYALLKQRKFICKEFFFIKVSDEKCFEPFGCSNDVLWCHHICFDSINWNNTWQLINNQLAIIGNGPQGENVCSFEAKTWA